MDGMVSRARAVTVKLILYILCMLLIADLLFVQSDPYQMSYINSYSASRDNWCTVGGDGGCRVGEVRAGTTSPMPDHKGFKLQ